jgi:hypothetical protein
MVADTQTLLAEARDPGTPTSFNLTFLGFELDDAVLRAYRRKYSRDPAATGLSLWAAFEDENPGMFAGMYVFWIQKA